MVEVEWRRGVGWEEFKEKFWGIDIAERHSKSGGDPLDGRMYSAFPIAPGGLDDCGGLR